MGYCSVKIIYKNHPASSRHPSTGGEFVTYFDVLIPLLWRGVRL